MAAWVGVESRKVYNNGNVELTVLLTALEAAGHYDIDTYLRDIKGKFLYSMRIVPSGGGVSPDNTYDLDIKDGDGVIILDTDANSATVAARHMGNVSNSVDLTNSSIVQYPMITEALTISVADMGAAGNQTTVSLMFVERLMV
jgi:hypothetical protein